VVQDWTVQRKERVIAEASTLTGRS
jgi:hypothetical protein